METRRTHVIVEEDRTGMHPHTLERAVLDHLFYTVGRDVQSASNLDVCRAMSYAVRDRLVHRWVKTQRTYYRRDVKRAYYLSAEFLLGRFLGDNLRKLGLWDVAHDGLSRYDLSLEEVCEMEPDPGLGNGGLGRLAACFLDSMATLELPGFGYGIRYEFGIFEQRIHEGWQQEVPDAWSRYGNPWEMPRHEYTVPVRFYGRVEHGRENGRYVSRWVDTAEILGVPYDMPVAGHGNDTVNTLRLWSARASKELDFGRFNEGDYLAALEEKSLTETISKVLYPNDVSEAGRELRLKQQYFFVACSIADILRRFLKQHDDFDRLPEQAAIQLNDTHPSIAVAELMRALVDDHDLDWERAWRITRSTIAYTNHTLLAEALEKWPVSLFERLLPRHLEIIYEINHRFLRQVQIHANDDEGMMRRTSIIGEGPEQTVRMAHLAVVGSHRVNGVAELHSDLVKKQVFPDFAQMFPERFTNVTNGVTPRRFIALANPALASAIDIRIGKGWVRDLDRLHELMRYIDDEEFHEELEQIKLDNKRRLARLVFDRVNIRIDPRGIVDTQIKRIHEYKRQLLNVMHIIAVYWALKDNPSLNVPPRTFLFSGKAAPGYWMAKLLIKLVHDVAETVNHDPGVRDRLKVVFVPNYSVTLAERIIPGTDVSEQISMAGKEASGTGNMKFAMNGALTVGTLDGANIEIREAVGPTNFFLFGHTAPQVRDLDEQGYDPRTYIEQSPRLQRVVESIASGFFSPDDRELYRPIVDELTTRDRYKHCADFDDYVKVHEEITKVWSDRGEWMHRVVCNIANTGFFSSDRSIREYAKTIWKIEPCPVRLDDGFDDAIPQTRLSDRPPRPSERPPPPVSDHAEE